MTRPSDDQILAFLDGSLDEATRNDLLDQLDRDPAFAAEFRHVAAGFATVTGHPGQPPVAAHNDVTAGSRGRVSPWWALIAAAATLATAVPTTWWLVSRAVPKPAVAQSGIPEASAPSFLLILHGRWPDAGLVDQAETRRRATEYWAWTTNLAERHVLLAAGDLRWEPGERLDAEAVATQAPASYVDDPTFLVGMLAVRAASYEDAVALARECPHLRYGGSVSVRRVGSGFVTAPGLGDWSGGE